MNIVILEFLYRFHGVSMCLRSLNNCLKGLGLGRKSTQYEDQVQAKIQQEIDGPGCMSGYRSMWHMLRSEGFMVPTSNIASILKELDPNGCEERRIHRLKQHVYINLGPNFCWHWMGMTNLSHLASHPWLHR